MNFLLSPHLSPTICLDVDSPAAQRLVWLPYAVRFKLDACELRMSLPHWQRLAFEERSALVGASLVDGDRGFRALALRLGATAGASRLPPDSTLRGDALHDLHEDVIESWRFGATAFSNYVLKKMASRKQTDQAT